MLDASTIKFWVLACVIYASLTYAAAHIIVGPEPIIDGGWYTLPAGHHGENGKRYGGRYEGVLYEQIRPHSDNLSDYTVYRKYIALKYAWKWCPQDSVEYLAGSMGGQPISPFRFRILPMATARLIWRNVSNSIYRSWAGLNIACQIATACLFCSLLLYGLKLSPVASFIGGALYLSLPVASAITSQPMVDAMSMLMMVLVLWTILLRSGKWFLVVSALAMATKEALIVVGPMWLINELCLDRSARNIARAVALAVWPLLVFMVIRWWLGASPLEVSFGHDMAHLGLPTNYLWRFNSWSLFFRRLAFPIFWTFGPLWIGLWFVRQSKFMLRMAVMVPLVILAIVFCAGAVCRPLSIIYPPVLAGVAIAIERIMPCRTQ